MSKLMISPSILDLDGGFEDIENVGVSIRDAALLGLVREREAYQQIGDETAVRKATAAGEVILGGSSEPDNCGFQAPSAPVDLVSGN